MISELFDRALNSRKRMVEVMPPASGYNYPWSGSNNLGNVVDFDPHLNNRQTILKMDEWGPPEVWTVSLAITHDEWAAAVRDETALLDITANISFGVGGSTQEVKLSWLNGTMISLPMNAISVTAEYPDLESFLGGDTALLPPNIRLSVQIARGYHHSNAVYMPTPPITLAAATAYDLGEVPAYAKSFEIISGSGNLPLNNIYVATNFLYLNTAGLASGSVYTVSQYTADFLLNKKIQLPPMVRHLVYDNVSNVAANIFPVYEIGV